MINWLGQMKSLTSIIASLKLQRSFSRVNNEVYLAQSVACKTILEPILETLLIQS